ncbi:hypothetical protein ACFFIX_02550 [Metabacillus herbersteinensis]|uniref:DUF4367 domain-containing protein n=1 Tax=Metabacillus herbersteinensis TaxID=283816 RepID=A0ABV6G9Y1_9BACI
MKQFAFIPLLFILLLVGCAVSDEELKTTTTENVQQGFKAEPQKPNEDGGPFSYFLPEGFEIKKTKNSNILLEEDGQRFILFSNENEENNSQVSYQTLASQYKNPVIQETIEDKNRFGYVFVNEIEKNTYEVTIGIGGTKMTTETKSQNVAESAKMMMTIVSSVQ